MKSTFLGAIVVALGLGATVPFVSWAQDQPQAQGEHMRRAGRGFGGLGGPGGRMGGAMPFREVMRDLTDSQSATLRAVCDTVVPSIQRADDPDGFWARKATDVGFWVVNEALQLPGREKRWRAAAKVDEIDRTPGDGGLP